MLIRNLLIVSRKKYLLLVKINQDFSTLKRIHSICWSAGQYLLSEVKSLSRVPLFATPWTVAYQAPPSMGFFRQEYWSELPFPSPVFHGTPFGGGMGLGKNTRGGCHSLLQEIFLTQGLNPGLPHCRQTLYHLSHQGSLSIYSCTLNANEPMIDLFEINIYMYRV